MKKTLPLFMLGVLSSSTSLAADGIDDKLLTTIQPNASGAEKFTRIQGGYYDSDVHYGIKQPVATKANNTQNTTYDSSLLSYSGQYAGVKYSGRYADVQPQYSLNHTQGHNSQYDLLIRQSAERHGVDPALVKAIMHTESSFNPYAHSPAGAQGLMQLMPGTARDMGVINVWDPAQNIEGGVKYIAWLSQRFSNKDHIIAAYNAGHANVRRYGGIPPFSETRNYVRKVNSRYQTLYAHDSNLGTRSSYQLAMNNTNQSSSTAVRLTTDNDSTPINPTLSQLSDRVYINSAEQPKP